MLAVIHTCHYFENYKLSWRCFKWRNQNLAQPCPKGLSPPPRGFCRIHSLCPWNSSTGLSLHLGTSMSKVTVTAGVTGLLSVLGLAATAAWVSRFRTQRNSGGCLRLAIRRCDFCHGCNNWYLCRAPSKGQFLPSKYEALRSTHGHSTGESDNRREYIFNEVVSPCVEVEI